MKSDGKPHMQSFSMKCLDEYQSDGLVYSVIEDAIYHKFCRCFPGGEGCILAKQNLPLRRHRDEFQYLKTEVINLGNLQDLLKFQSEAGLSCLKVHFEEGHRDATYKSKTIQNQLVQIIGDQILDGIPTNVKTAKYFAALADEATDIELQTQLTMTLLC